MVGGSKCIMFPFLFSLCGQLNSGLGQLILKEEMEKENRERAALLASRYDSPLHSGEQRTLPSML